MRKNKAFVLFDSNLLKTILLSNSSTISERNSEFRHRNWFSGPYKISHSFYWVKRSILFLEAGREKKYYKWLKTK